MIFDVNILKAVMDKARQKIDADQVGFPRKDAAGNKLTYCNINAFKVAQGIGLNLFWNEEAQRPMMANEMVEHMDASPLRFMKFTEHLDAWKQAHDGGLVFAAQKEEGHGHIAPIYPTEGMITSGKWRAQVPECSNVGVRNDIMGVNFAFADPPDYYRVL